MENLLQARGGRPRAENLYWNYTLKWFSKWIDFAMTEN